MTIPAKGPVIGALCTALALAGPAMGQATAVPATPLRAAAPSWMTNWSPLARLADLPRELPGSAAFSDVFTTPALRVGEFWTAGNPGALARELDDTRSEFRLTLDGASGDYARPFDPAGVGTGRLSASGWTPLGENGAAIGDAVFGRTSLRDSIFADVLLPYGSNPFFVSDTIGDPTQRSAVRIEGALGWEFARLGVGFAAGWEGQSTRTAESPVPRLDRTASPGLSLGLSYDLGNLRLGALGRFKQTAEFIQVTTIAQPSRIYQIEGYEEPVPLDLQPATYSRRFERDAWALGASAGFEVLGGTWAFFGRREVAAEDQFVRTLEQNDVTDRWDARGWNAGFAGQWAFGRRGWLLTATGGYRTLTGEAFQASIGDVLFTVDESRLEGGADLRGRLGDDWHLGGRLEFSRSEHDRRDLLAQAASDIQSTQFGGSLEVGRTFGSRFGVSAGGSLTAYAPSGTIPDPATLGPVYGRYLGPGLAMELTDALTSAVMATVRWQSSDRVGFWIRGVLGSLRPDEVTLPLSPTGSRRGWRVSAGAVLEDAWPE